MTPEAKIIYLEKELEAIAKREARMAQRRLDIMIEIEELKKLSNEL